MDASPSGKENAFPALVVGMAIFVFLFGNLFSGLVFEHIPHVHDEADYLFQARLFLSGRLYADSPCSRESFDFPHMINNGRWYSQYPPGFPLLLTIGLLLGAPWLVNPLLGALAVIVFYLLGRELYGSRVALLSSLLGAFSMWFLVMSSTMLSHPASLLFTSLFLLFIFRSRENPSVTNGVLAGAAWGMALLIRPFNALMIALPYLVYFAVLTIKRLRWRWRNACALALSAMVFIALLLAYNQLTNGHPLRMGYVVSYGKDVLPGFGHAGVPEFSLTPLRGAENIGAYLRSINADLFGWPISSFLALLPLLWFRRIDPRLRKKDLLLAAGFLSLLVGLYFYWGTSPLLGARLLFEGATMLVLLSARGIAELPGLLAALRKRVSPAAMERATAAVLVVFFAHAFLVRFPRWVWPRDTGDPLRTIGHNFAGTTPAIHRTVRSLNLEPAVVILRLFSLPSRYFPTGGWGSGFIYNDPDLGEDVIYANYGRTANLRLFDCFPGRNFYLYLGTLEKGMLIPLEVKDGRLVYGEPLAARGGTKGGVVLAAQPKRLFTLYSAEFEAFLDRLYAENGWADIDAARLRDLGLAQRKEGRFLNAAFSFEAALQVETDPENRRDLINLLLPCYERTGQTEIARKIRKFLEDINFDERRMYRVFPERGL